ncbi:hypothetical protein ACOMHN_051594 [Nucella lapillus]
MGHYRKHCIMGHYRKHCIMGHYRKHCIMGHYRKHCMGHSWPSWPPSINPDAHSQPTTGHMAPLTSLTLSSKTWPTHNSSQSVHRAIHKMHNLARRCGPKSKNHALEL